MANKAASPWPEGFLEQFQRVCEEKQHSAKTEEQISAEVYAELQMDFPLLDLDQLDVFLTYYKSQETPVTDGFLPSPRYLRGLLSGMDEEFSSSRAASEAAADREKVLKYAEIISLTIFIPIVKFLAAIPAQEKNLQNFLRSYGVEVPQRPESTKNETEVIDEDVSSVIDMIEQEYEELEEDPDDFEWESYDAPSSDVFENAGPKENEGLVLYNGDVDWSDKVTEILMKIDQTACDTIFTNLGRDHGLFEDISKCIQSLFVYFDSQIQMNEMQGATQLENIQKIIAQLTYLLQNHMIGHKEHTEEIFTRLMETLDTHGSQNSLGTVTIAIKQALLLNILSKAVHAFSSRKNRPSRATSELIVTGIKSQLDIYKDRISCIHNTLKSINKQQDDSLPQNTLEQEVLSSAVIEVTEIIAVLSFIVNTEKGQLDTVVSEELLGGRVIQDLVMLLVFLQKISLRSKLQEKFTDSCLDFLVDCSIYQPSIGAFLSKVRSWRELFTSAAFGELYSPACVVFLLNSFRISKYKDIEYYDGAVKLIVQLFEAKATPSDDGEEVNAATNALYLQREKLLENLIEWNEFFPHDSLFANPNYKSLADYLREMLKQQTTVSDQIPKKQKKHKQRLRKLLKLLVHQIQSQKAD